MDDWETPKWLLDIAFPNGFFDPCPLRGTGGLEREWPTDRPVFINPPYSNPRPWVARAYLHGGPVALLLPISPESEWWEFYHDKFKVTPISVRLRFRGYWDKSQRALSGDGAMKERKAPFRGITFCVAWWWKP